VARRKSNDVLGDIFEIAAMLPWWVGVVLAAIAYLAFHYYAGGEVLVPTKPGQMGEVIVGQFVRTLSSILQYVIPLVLLGGAVASYFGRRKRATLFDAAGSGSASHGVRNLDWREFEMLVGEAFRLGGYEVLETGGGGADGGIDLALRKDGELFLVQCKQWRALKVSVNVVRELYGVMADRGAAGGFVVTSGVFTPDAKAFASGRHIDLIDGAALTEMIRSVERLRDGAPLPSSPRPSGGSTPPCPRCNSPMTRRVATRGPDAGKSFWGCSAFPRCRGTRPV